MNVSKRTLRLKPAKARTRSGKVKRSPQRRVKIRVAPPHRPPRPSAKPEVAASLRGDCLQLYLREICQVKLLTPPEERALARRVKRGDRQAREHMIKANLRLVVKIARNYEGMGLPLLDLINEGNIGLMKGVSRFEPKMGTKLSTYVSWWIKQAIRRALSNQAKTIRLPVHIVDRLGQIQRASTHLHQTLKREPTDEEIAAELGLATQRVRECRDASRSLISLDSPVGDDESLLISEVIADPAAVAPLDQLIKTTNQRLLREVLATLKTRARKILAMRFGLDGGEPQTLETVGHHFRVTRERIRQIQDQALEKLRVKIQKQQRVNYSDN